MKIIFFGTPDFVLPIAKALYKFYQDDFIAVVTQTPKETGRDKTVERSAVDNWAYKHKIDVIYDYNDLPHADLGIVAAYGKIIPGDVISKFPNGILNIHPSLLPKYRGASPIQAQIINGEIQTGVTVIRMDEKMDHGPIVSYFRDEISNEDTNETLRIRLFEKSAEFLINLIPNYLNGKINLKEQNHAEATFTKIITKEDGFINNPVTNPVEAERKFRAYNPWPGIWTNVALTPNSPAKRLKILKLHLEDTNLILDEVQLEGKTTVTWEEFRRGYPQFEFADEPKRFENETS